MAINKAWHQANPMPKKPTLEQRIAWHKAHAEHCRCREMPATVRAEIQQRPGGDHPNVALLRVFYQAARRGDRNSLAAVVAGDVVWHLPGGGPLAGDHRGIEAVFRAMRAFAERSAGTIRVEVHDILANDEHGVALLQATAQRGGKRYDMREVDIFHVRGGRIAEFWSFSEDQRLTDEFWS